MTITIALTHTHTHDRRLAMFFASSNALLTLLQWYWGYLIMKVSVIDISYTMCSLSHVCENRLLRLYQLLNGCVHCGACSTSATALRFFARVCARKFKIAISFRLIHERMYTHVNMLCLLMCFDICTGCCQDA
jgi:hypothetical protein